MQNTDFKSTGILCWFRNDLRLTDNAMIAAAVKLKCHIHFVFIYDESAESKFPIGAATKWWLHQSLSALQANLEKLGHRLLIRSGSTFEHLSELAKTLNCTSIYWNRRYEPHLMDFDTQLKTQLKSMPLDIQSFPGNLLIEPWAFSNKQQKPYQVFTPFWRALKVLPLGQTCSSSPLKSSIPQAKCKSLAVSDLKLLPSIKWDTGFYNHWTPGELGALKQLKFFLNQKNLAYDDTRNIPSISGTSRLSPHLHFGEISPRTIWQLATQAMRDPANKTKAKHIESFLREVAWREFSSHLLFHFPSTTKAPLKSEFARFPWQKNKTHLKAWQKGLTGYPIVDAGMRELWHTGWMHNRVRMIVASFLVKNLMIHWLEGVNWFWDTLVDADLANNTMGWQWVAGCGADASPYYRIFNPILQGEKFDPEGTYVKTWIPELKHLDKKWIHKPFTAPSEFLENANVKLGKTYPKPLVDLISTRERALEKYKQLKKN